jgi:hypothetical protein
MGVILLTSVTVDATLSPNGFSQSALGILASRAVPEEQCPNGMQRVVYETRTLCVDRFESSPDVSCPSSEVQSSLDTRNNIDAPGCVPVSQVGAVPWTFVTFHQAKELCAKAGKRLPSSEEWFLFALGTPDTGSSCNTSSQNLTRSSESSLCVNGYGVHDAIGNAWEWVDAEVIDGTYNGRTLPDSGYVVNADRDGIASITDPRMPNPDLHEDYFWSERQGQFGVLRGGFYGSGSDGGLYSVQAKTAYSLASVAIGFRCVVDI